MKKILLAFVFSLMIPQGVFAKLSNDPQVDQWAYNHVGVYTAWDFHTGSRDVVVAIIDNGFDTFHPDLKENVWKNVKEKENNGLDDDGNGYVDDVWGWNFVQEDVNRDGVLSESETKGSNDPTPKVSALTEKEKQEGVFHHGTVVAGIIGAVGDNSVYGTGLNWKVRLMNVKVIDNSGSGDLVLLGPAIRYAVDNGAHIINISMVGNFIDTNVLEALRYANQKGVAVFAAAGNDARFLDQDPRHPVCADQFEARQLVLGVSAIDQTHHLTRFSNYGARCIDITAPGMDILSALRYDPSSGLDKGYGGLWNGTSFATPFVSGAAALIKAIQPSWQAQDIYNILLGTVHKTPPQDDVVYTHLFGKGLLQIDRAVKQAVSGIKLEAPSAVPVAPQAPVIAEPKSIAPVSPQKPSIPIPSGVIFEETSGNGQVFDAFSSETGFTLPKEIKSFPFLQGLESISRFTKDSGETRYGVLYFRADGNSIVRLYNHSFERVSGFKKRVPFASTLVLADIVGDAEPEIVLAPKVADTNLFVVYDFLGNELFRVNAQQKHAGVSITKKINTQTKKYEIAVLYKQGNEVLLETYDTKGTLVQQKQLSPKTELGGLFFGDVDGDGFSEYVMVVVDSDTVWVRYYDEKANLIKRVPAFQVVNKEKKLNIQFDDLNADGKMELVVNEKFGGKGVYGVFGKGEIVKQVYSLKNQSKSNYFVFPLFTR